MPVYLLLHRHDPGECGAAFASWRGVDSPLRGRPTHGSCAGGDHRLWWEVEAPSPGQALAMLPEYVAARTEVAESGEVLIP